MMSLFGSGGDDSLIATPHI